MPNPVRIISHILTSLGLFTTNGMNNPLIETQNGMVEGTIGYSREGRQYFQFLGIPYAMPPVGHRRFEPPESIGKWDGILKANSYGAPCMQFEVFVEAIAMGEENCLFLNIFQPVLAEEREKPLPVMMYIHGGYLTSGSATEYSPKYFMDEDVIIVTINYRLGALGFLNTGDDVVRGNMGLKDQVMALRWIRDNIRNFNGDPDQVTIFGASAGSVSVHYHVLSPLSKGLFHRAIMQAGTTLCPWAFTVNPAHQAKRYAKQLNCPIDNSSVLVACLKNMDPVKLVYLHSAIMNPVNLQDDLFVGSVEATKKNDTFLTEKPFDLLSSGHFNKVPILTGLEIYPEILSKIDEKWNEYVPILLHYDPARKDISKKIREYYFKNSTTISSDMATLTKMMSDGIFFHATHWTAKLHSKWAPVYLYYYTYRSFYPTSYSVLGAVKNLDEWAFASFKILKNLLRDTLRKYFQPSKDPARLGPCHGDEVILLWNMYGLSGVGMMHSDSLFSKALITTFVSFAKSNEKLRFKSVEWPIGNQSSNELIYMELNRTPRVIGEPFKSSMEFLDSLDIRYVDDNHNW